MTYKPFADYYDFSLLPQDTLYRFAELEINNAYSHLSHLFRYTNNPVIKTENLLSSIYYGTANISEEEGHRFTEALLSIYFRRPQKAELINYMLYHHQSYKTIQTTLKASPNTIRSFRLKPAPMLRPVLDDWTPEALERWDRAKLTFNLWNEILIHHPINRESPEIDD